MAYKYSYTFALIAPSLCKFPHAELNCDFGVNLVNFIMVKHAYISLISPRFNMDVLCDDFIHSRNGVYACIVVFKEIEYAYARLL